jgi:Flp pilus assembly protein TadD
MIRLRASFAVRWRTQNEKVGASETVGPKREVTPDETSAHERTALATKIPAAETEWKSKMSLGPPKKDGALLHAPIQGKLQLPQNNPRSATAQVEQMLRQKQSLRVIQAPFGFVFWFLEQKIARLTDEIEIERTRG